MPTFKDPTEQQAEWPDLWALRFFSYWYRRSTSGVPKLGVMKSFREARKIELCPTWIQLWARAHLISSQ
jgi:hypothetical protein